MAIDSNIRISVVIATYNRADMVKEAVLAAWNQTLPPAEIIVSDDNSTDNTIELLSKLRESVPVLRVIRNEKNSGGVPNWNKAVSAATGDFVAWCSDDDRFYPDHLEKAAKYLIDHPEISMTFASFINAESEEGGGERIEKTEVLRSKDPILINNSNVLDYNTKFFNWPFHPSTLVFLREVWGSVGEFDDGYQLADTDWFYRVVSKYEIAYLPYYGVLNRRHASNWSTLMGAAEMQREIGQIVDQFVEKNMHAVHPIQVKRWNRKKRAILLRIFVSRCRAGERVAAYGVYTMLVSSPSGDRISGSIGKLVFGGVFSMLKYAQIYFLGGVAKYKNLGVHVPK